jgi:non-ribosomal peptide synthetase component F
MILVGTNMGASHFRGARMDVPARTGIAAVGGWMSGHAPHAHDGERQRANRSAGPGNLPAGEAGSFAGQAADHGGSRAAPELIEGQAGRYPGRPAVCPAGRTLTCQQLDQLANGLAATVAERGVGKGDRVAVLLVNSLEMPVTYPALLLAVPAGAPDS